MPRFPNRTLPVSAVLLASSSVVACGPSGPDEVVDDPAFVSALSEARTKYEAACVARCSAEGLSDCSYCTGWTNNCLVFADAALLASEELLPTESVIAQTRGTWRDDGRGTWPCTYVVDADGTRVGQSCSLESLTFEFDDEGYGSQTNQGAYTEGEGEFWLRRVELAGSGFELPIITLLNHARSLENGCSVTVATVLVISQPCLGFDGPGPDGTCVLNGAPDTVGPPNEDRFTCAFSVALEDECGVPAWWMTEGTLRKQ